MDVLLKVFFWIIMDHYSQDITYNVIITLFQLSFSFCLPPPPHGEEQKEKESRNNAIIILYVSEFYFAAESTML